MILGKEFNVNSRPALRFLSKVKLIVGIIGASTSDDDEDDDENDDEDDDEDDDEEEEDDAIEDLLRVTFGIGGDEPVADCVIDEIEEGEFFLLTPGIIGREFVGDLEIGRCSN